ncbi:hypothetical protein ACHAXS_001614 [Conticribra weissflogii]
MKKFKACFCSHCYKQMEEIDIFETSPHVVQWTIVWLMITIGNI